MKKQVISIISPCYNEEKNIDELYARVLNFMSKHTEYDFEFLIIDNASTDETVNCIKKIIDKDSRVRLIVNNRNFGPVRSPYWGILQTSGDATIYLASDLQDPPELMTEFIKAWKEGFLVVMGQKPTSETHPLMHWLRRTYYKLLDKISDVSITKDITGFGLYDKKVLDLVRQINDPNPYLRGLIDEIGFPVKTVQFNQPKRKGGKSKHTFHSLYDIAMLGIVSHSIVPLRLASFIGLVTGVLSILIALGVLVAKLIWWDRFTAGLAPVAIMLFMILGMILFFIGILGEYIGSIHTYVRNRPIVVEKERVNFQSAADL
jgi:glycosyltransferase involved in cell wall biosynthesis